MEDLKVTIIQANLQWENKHSNMQLFSQRIGSISEKTDLIVLPEMFTTGFSMKPQEFAEAMDGPTVEWMQEQAQLKNCVVTGSFICEENGNYFNRLLWVNADGSFQTYDKRHLFRMANEDGHYTAGQKKVIVELKGWKICPLVCYDLRFPVWSRNTLLNQVTTDTIESIQYEYDVLIYVANWPEVRSYPWKTLLLARAIENQCYVVGLNRVGDDGNAIYHSGDSAVINAKGVIISQTKPHEESVETVALNYTELATFRKNFPAMLDADKFEIH
jgi:omega-amidase